jgi:hypothetical protein
VRLQTSSIRVVESSPQRTVSSPRAHSASAQAFALVA